MKRLYVRCMDIIYIACMAASGLVMALITLFICWSVFTRYVLDRGAYWPEPSSVLLILLLTFLGGAAAYRAGVHISVGMFVNQLAPGRQRLLGHLVDLFMAALSLFLLIYGWSLVQATFNQVHPEFIWVSVGVTYLPIPLGSLFTLLFVLEKVWIGPPDPRGVIHSEVVDGGEPASVA